MRVRLTAWKWQIALGLCCWWPAGEVFAAAPTAEQALKLNPVQRFVACDRPDDPAACTIKAQKFGQNTGWVVFDASGQILRRFLDTNGDNVVDQWCYFQQGAETYRDIDATFNGKADEFRWLNTSGSRWGVDQDEDGRIDAWKQISAEEATLEAVQAIATRDAQRFAALLLTANELRSLGLGTDRQADLAQRIAAAPTAFAELIQQQKVLTEASAWADFGGSLPSAIPAGDAGSTKDLVVYENVVAMVETAGEASQVQFGTLVQVGSVWRLIDAPTIGDEAPQSPNLITSASLRPEGSAGAGASAETQQLLEALEALDQKIAAADAAQAATLNAQRADLIERIAGSVSAAEDREQWLRQLADTVSAAVQSGQYPAGVERLKELQTRLASDPANAPLVAYIQWRQMTAEYSLSLQAENPDYEAIQKAWLEQLQQFVTDYPSSPDAADALMQLAIAQEFAGEEEQAKERYQLIVTSFPESAAARKAAGAIRRLECVGRTIELAGVNFEGRKVDLAAVRNKVVLIHYWASWCEPCVPDMQTIQQLVGKYGKNGLIVIGVCLDTDREGAEAFLKTNRMTWPQIYDDGGLEGRLASELGILTLPTMLLLDKDGKVVNRNATAATLDRDIGALLR